jgi:hypothetical protein
MARPTDDQIAERRQSRPCERDGGLMRADLDLARTVDRRGWRADRW